MPSKIEPGIDTTEYKEAKSAGTWGIVAMVLGVLLTVGATIVDSLGGDTKTAIIAGAVIATAGILEKTLVSLGYIKGRSDVKSHD
jgi:hypothetical protein